MNPDLLTDMEKSAIIAFRDNAAMRQAVKKVILSPFDLTLADIVNKAADPRSDEKFLGQTVRAYAQAAQFVEEGFSRLDHVRLDQPERAKPNPAL